MPRRRRHENRRADCEPTPTGLRSRPTGGADQLAETPRRPTRETAEPSESPEPRQTAEPRETAEPSETPEAHDEDDRGTGASPSPSASPDDNGGDDSGHDGGGHGSDD